MKGGEAVTVIAGLDEAGLGPLLGPLTIGFSVLSVPASEPDPWKLLRKVVSKNPKQDAKKLVVADSKKVFTRNARGRKRLEATALGFASLLNDPIAPPTSPEQFLFRGLAPRRSLLGEHPWYGNLPEVPAIWDRSALELRAAILKREMDKAGCRLLDAGVRIVPAGELNASFEETGNKGTTVWTKTREVLRHVWREHGSSSPEVTVDLLGGRMNYGPILGRGFPEASVRLLFAREHHCAYELEGRGPRGAGRSMRIVFRKEGEEHSFAVALASCLAKYARETVMSAFNGYFEGLSPRLRPTAGYRNDAQRWLEDAAPLLRRTKLPQGVLVRER